MIERSVRIDDVPGGEQYEIQKLSNTVIEISNTSDLTITTTTTTTTIASCVSSLRPSNKTLPWAHQVNDSPA